MLNKELLMMSGEKRGGVLTIQLDDDIGYVSVPIKPSGYVQVYFPGETIPYTEMRLDTRIEVMLRLPGAGVTIRENLEILEIGIDFYALSIIDQTKDSLLVISIK